MLRSGVLKIPQHVGIIMDGNRRWARKRLLPSSAGHNAGMNNMISLAEKASETGVRYLTVYALSTENLQRPKEELDGIIALIRGHFSECVDRLIAKNATVRVIGDLSLFPEDVQKILKDGVDKSPKEARFTFIMALGYGARNEIVQAANAAVVAGKPVDERGFASLLYTHDIPDPDFIIRTGGEIRLSNFLLWQAAYAELYFTDVLFPDFSDAEFEKAIEAYSGRTRRFGKV